MNELSVFTPRLAKADTVCWQDVMYEVKILYLVLNEKGKSVLRLMSKRQPQKLSAEANVEMWFLTSFSYEA